MSFARSLKVQNVDTSLICILFWSDSLSMTSWRIFPITFEKENSFKYQISLSTDIFPSIYVYKYRKSAMEREELRQLT